MSTIVLVLQVSQVTVNQGRAATTATVTNKGTTAESVVLGAFPALAGSAGTAISSAVGWTTVERPQREVQAGATEQFTVTFEPPAGVAAGTYPVRFLAYSAYGAPEESADQARQVDVVLPVATPVPPAPQPKWWIYAVAAALVLIVGVVASFVLRADPDPCADGSCPSSTPTPGVPTPVVENMDWILAPMREGDISTPANPAKITLRVDGDEVSGQTGCNTYSGTWMRSQGTLEVGDTKFTVDKCFAPQVTLKANKYRSILPHVTTLTSDGETMELTTDDNRSLFFKKS